MKNLLPVSFTTLLLFATSLVVAAQSTVILQDTFDDDTLGHAPNAPDVGTSAYLGGAHAIAIIENFASKSLRSLDASTSDGFVSEWFPISSPAVFEVSYEYRVEGFTGTSSFASQQISFHPSATTDAIRLIWHPTSFESSGTSTSLSWAVGTTYQIRVQVNCNSDTYNLLVDGAVLLTDEALSFDCDTFRSFASHSHVLQTITQSIDEIKATTLSPLFEDGFESGDTAGWSSTQPPLPTGNTCTTALPYEGGLQAGGLFDNTASGVIDSCGTNNSVDEWLAYTASCTGTATVSTCYGGTDLDTILSLWGGSSCPTIAETDCNDDGPASPPGCELNGVVRKSQLSFGTVSGTTYYVRVSGYNNAVGNYEVGISCSP